MSDRTLPVPLLLGRTAALAVLLVAGCQNELFKDDMTPYTVSPDRLRALEPLDLSKIEFGPPVPPELAMQAATAGGFRPTSFDKSRTLSIAEVRALTLANNLDLRVQLVAPDIARATITEAEAKFDATFFADYTRQDQLLSTQLQTNSGVFSDQGDIGLRIPLATGGTVKFQPTYTDSTDISITGSDQAVVSASISQPLLRGAGVEVNTASIRIAKLQGQATDSRTKLESLRILANADRAYWNLYRAYRDLEVRQQQYELAIDQLRRARNRVEAGDVPPIEILRAESGVGSTLERLINADAALRNRQRDLKRMLNDPSMQMDDGSAVIPATQPNPLGLQLNAHRLADAAVRDRMEMLELELQVAVDATNVEVARNAALPLVTLDYDYKLTGTGSGLTDSFSDLGNKDQYTFSIRAEIPITNEVRLSQLRRAVLQRVQRLATKDARAQAIRQEVLNAVDSLDTAWQRIMAARLTAVLAARTYEAERRQFDVGLRTSTDVLDAASRLGDAQSQEVAALAGYEIAMIDVAFATGNLAGGTRLRWDQLEINDPAVPSKRGLDSVVGEPTQAAVPAPAPARSSAPAAAAAPVAAPSAAPPAQ
jgi:outer membrane protein TolC